MPDFSPLITLAYMRILGRPPDAAGLESYNRAMNSGLSEALMRESLLRSNEYATKNPDAAGASKRSSTKATRPRKKAKKPRATTRKTRKR